jgi:hypothetical protein
MGFKWGGGGWGGGEKEGRKKNIVKIGVLEREESKRS